MFPSAAATYSSPERGPTDSPSPQGWYEFRLCGNSDAGARDSQRCLDKHLLAMADGSGSRYALDGSIRGEHTVHVQLPRGVSCAHCVLQWTWTVGESVACVRFQELFRVLSAQYMLVNANKN